MPVPEFFFGSEDEIVTKFKDAAKPDAKRPDEDLLSFITSQTKLGDDSKKNWCVNPTHTSLSAFTSSSLDTASPLDLIAPEAAPICTFLVLFSIILNY